MISLCMIVRDEEKFLGRCLQAARPAVDEIIVVDTGSKDRTVEIAEEHDAKIFPFSWRDDFSAARNAALERARGDWILVLDADETLEEGAAGKIREAVAEDRHCGFFMPLTNIMEDGKRSTCPMVRLFVNRPEIRYRYLIHEQMLPDLVQHARQSGRPIGRLDSGILHRGYQARVMASRDKAERNERIFEKQLSLYPRDLYSWYKYVEFLAGIRADPARIGAALEKAHDLLGSLPEANARDLPFAAEIEAHAALDRNERLGDPQGALSLVRTAAARLSPTPHLFLVKAGLERTLGYLDEAKRSFERLLALDGCDCMVPVKEGATTWLAHTGFGLCALDLGHDEEAARHLEDSIRCHPDQPDAYAGLATLGMKRGDEAEALRWLMELLKTRPDHGPAWATGGEILARMGLDDKAREWREKAAAHGA